MIPRPCPTHLSCPEGDYPVINYSSEAPDPFNFLGIYFGKAHCTNVDDNQWQWGSSLHFCFSQVSEADAILCAQIAAQLDCTATWSQSGGGNPVKPILPPGDPGCFGFTGITPDSPTPIPGGPASPNVCPVPDDPTDPGFDPTNPDDLKIQSDLFFNGQQSCRVCCQGGPCATYTTRGGIFKGTTQAEADLWGAVFACRQAILQLPQGCQPPLPDYPPLPRLPSGKTLRQAFWNDPQTCQSECPDGTMNTYTTPAAMFSGSTQNSANGAAFNYACRTARLQRLCLSDLPAGTCCVNQMCSKVITATSSPAVEWSMGGTLPPGMEIVFASHTATISGTPNTPGNYLFNLNASNGSNTISKSYTLSVLGISNTPTAGNVGVPYNFTFTAAGGMAPYTYSITNGSLPLGLTMSGAGVISGTPTAAATNSFQVTVTDSGP